MIDDDGRARRHPTPEEEDTRDPSRVPPVRSRRPGLEVPLKKKPGNVSGAAEHSDSPPHASRTSGLDPSGCDSSGISLVSALRSAIQARDEAAVRRSLDDLRHFHWYHGNNRDIVSVAVQAGSRNIVELLLDRGAPVGGARSDSELDNPLVAAVRTGRTDLVELLLQRGAYINSSHAQSDTPLAAAAGAGDVGMLSLLLDRGASLNHTPLASDTALVAAARAGNPEVVKLLLDHGAEVNQTTFHGDAPLVAAVLKGNIEAVKLLLDRGADVDCEDFNLGTPLRIAIEAENMEMVQLLLDSGADVFFGWLGATCSPLTAAARLGSQQTVQVLLAKEMRTRDSKSGSLGTGSTTEDATPATAGSPDVFGQDGAERPPKGDDNLSISRRMPANLPPDLPTDSSHPLYGRPLIAAAVNGHKEVARMLLAYGAEMFKDACARDDPFCSPGSYSAFVWSLEAWSESTQSPGDDPYVSISFPDGMIDEAGFIVDFDFVRDAMIDSVAWQWEVPAEIRSTRPFCLEDEVAVIASNLSTSSLGSECFRALTWAEYLAHLGIRTSASMAFLGKLGKLMKKLRRLSNTARSGQTASRLRDSRLRENLHYDLVRGFPGQSLFMTFGRDSARIELQKSTAFRTGVGSDIFPVMELLCTSLRPPSIDHRHNLSSAKYRLAQGGRKTDPTSRASGLRLTMALGSEPLPDIRDGCWRDLFDSCHILHLSKPMFGCKHWWSAGYESENCLPHPMSHGRGLEMSFDLMVALAAVEYPLVVEGGVVLVGCETALVPTAFYPGDSKKGNIAQFHLITSGHDADDRESGGLLNPYRADLGRRLRTTDIDQFRSTRCFLGWCSDAHINLGTRHLPARVDYSGGRDTPRSRRLDGYSAMVQLGVNPISPLSAVLGVQTNYKFSSHRRRFTPFSGYATLLRDTAAKTAVVYDASQRRGWLVPVLSLLLHMSHAYVLNCGDGPRDNVPFAQGHDDATELIRFLEWSGDQPVLAGTGHGENGGSEAPGSAAGHDLFLRQLLLGLRTNLLGCSEATKQSEGDRLHGFEFMDVITPPDRGACMKTLDISSAGITWVEVANAADAVVVCANIGEVITPKQSTSRGSSRCNTMPQQLDYLAATLPCLDRITRRKGCALISARAIFMDIVGNVLDSTQGASDEVKISDDSVWRLHGDPFGSCEHNEAGPESCWERGDLLQRVTSRKLHQMLIQKAIRRSKKRPTLQDMGMPPILQAGAVVFGKPRLPSVHTTAQVKPTPISAPRVADSTAESLGHFALCERNDGGLLDEGDASLVLSSAAVWGGEDN